MFGTGEKWFGLISVGRTVRATERTRTRDLRDVRCVFAHRHNVFHRQAERRDDGLCDVVPHGPTSEKLRHRSHCHIGLFGQHQPRPSVDCELPFTCVQVVLSHNVTNTASKYAY